MKMNKSRTISRIAFGLGLFAICGPAFAGIADFIQLVGVALSIAFPQYTFAIALAMPAVGEAVVRRKGRGGNESS